MLKFFFVLYCAFFSSEVFGSIRIDKLSHSGILDFIYLNKNSQFHEPKFISLDFEGNITAYCEDLNEIIWSVKISDMEYVSDGKIAHFGDQLFIVNGSSFVYSIDLYTGEVLWSKNLPGFIIFIAEYHDGKLFVSTDRNDIYALDPRNGSILWSSSDYYDYMKKPLFSGEMFYLDSDFLIPVLNQNKVCFIEINNLNNQMHNCIEGFSSKYGVNFLNSGFAAYPIKHNGKFVFSFRDIGTFCVENGKIIWHNDHVASQSIYPMSGNRILISDKYGNLLILDLEDGSIVSNYNKNIGFNKWLSSDSWGLVDMFDSKAIIQNALGRLIAVNLDSGKVQNLFFGSLFSKFYKSTIANDFMYLYNEKVFFRLRVDNG